MSRGWQQRVKRWHGWVLLVFVVAAFVTIGTTRDHGARTPDERVQEIAKHIACPVCDGESVFDSANAASAAIRAEVRTQVFSTKASNDEIIAYIVQKFGARTQLVPKATGFDSLVWVLPAVAFVCAATALYFAFRRWRLNVDTVPDDSDRALVDAALKAATPTVPEAENESQRGEA